MFLTKWFRSALFFVGICQSSWVCAAENSCSKDILVLTHSLIGTEKVADNKFFYYRLHLASQQKLAENEFQLICVNCFNQPTGRAKLWIDKTETVWINDGSKKLPLKEFKATFGNFLDGEFVDFIILDKQGSILANTRIFPKPVECKTSDGAILNLQLHSKEGQYVLQGVGFKPNEILCLISQSEEEISMPFLLEASEDGKISAGLSPQVLGKSFGHASLTITRKDGSQLKLSYLWGIPEEKLS